MIPKGNQRGGGQQLATHLMNSFDNDRVEILDVRGAIAADLHGAFAEWYAQSKATDCRKYLYSLSINPDHRQGPYTRDHYYDFIDRVEKKLRLTNQPRAIVKHVKKGREHYHVIWSRIDGAKGKAVQMSHDRQKLRKVAQEYARDHHLILPPGMQNDRGAARFAFRAAAENLAEKQQQDRSGISKRERRDAITRAWHGSKDATTLIRALEASGFFLARGDQRSYVVVDLSGEIHSLSRQITGVKAKDIEARLASLDIDKMPSAAAAQTHARNKRQALLPGSERQDSAARKAALSEQADAAKAEAQKRRDELAKAHAVRRSELEGKKEKLAQTHEAERKALAQIQAAKTEKAAKDRAAKEPKGVIAFLARITGYNTIAAWRDRREDRKTAQGQEQQREALARRHAREMEDFRHRESGLTALEKRERRSLETSIRRDAFSRAAEAAKEKTPAPVVKEQPRLTPTQQEKLADFRRTGVEITRPPEQPKKRTQDAAKEKPAPKNLKPAFAEAAKEKTAAPQHAPQMSPTQQEKLADFRRTSVEITKPPEQPKRTQDAAKEKPALADLKPVFADVAKPESEPRELTEAQKRALAAKKAFNRHAAGRGQDREKDRDREHYRRPPPDFSLRR